MPAPVWLGSALAGAGSVIGGLFGRSGQHSANAANLQIARENREWQERMSSTANQRAAKDLEKAGLNRILALGKPASTPAGNVATMQNADAKLQEGISGGITSAMQAKLIAAQVRNINAQTALTTAQKNAIAPAETIGRGVQSLEEMAATPYNKLVDRTSRLIDETDYRSMFNTTADMARKNIDKIARSLNLNPNRSRRQLLDVVNQMDLPPMNENQKYEWALKNPEKIKQFLERKKRRGF